MRRKLLLIAGFLLLPMTVAVFWFSQPTDPINAANFDRIEIGMTEQQVEKILGGIEGGEIQFELHGHLEKIENPSFPKFWFGHANRAITVNFHFRDGKVASKEFFNPGPWDRIKAWWGGYELLPNGILPVSRKRGELAA